jgi:signal transduction histidine kinase
MTPKETSKYNAKFLRKRALFESDSQEIIDLLHKSAVNAQALVAADECSLALFDPGESILILYSTQHEAGEQLKYIHVQPDEDIKKWIEHYRIAQLLTSAEQTSTLHPAALSFVDVPLVEHGTFIGILSVGSSNAGAFNTQTRKILSIFADQITLMFSQLLKTNAKLLEAIHAKTSFFSLITHELRSPLNTINGYLELAMSGVGGELNEQQYEFVQRARVGSEHLYALLENMLLVSRADNGQMQLHREIIRLQDVIENAVEEWELTASDHHIAIEINSKNNIPKIYADTVRLQQVLRNLISNALNFTPDSGTITINTSIGENIKNGEQSERHNDEEMGILKLQVTDTGVGIAPEHHTRIFERFIQVPNKSMGRAGGPGLGLAIVKMIVELHGGSVFIESVPGQGSTFTCMLPCILP